MKSLSEIETTSKRASKAVGFSWGVAEEIAKGIRLLELFGFPGVKNLNQYYKLINKKNFDDQPWFYEAVELSENYRLSDLQCALGISQIKRIENFNNKKKILHKYYLKKIKKLN